MADQVPTYYANVANGFVVDVRKTTRAAIRASDEVYPGTWIRVPSMVQYPAIGWSYDGTRFSPPVSTAEEGSAEDGE